MKQPETAAVNPPSNVISVAFYNDDDRARLRLYAGLVTLNGDQLVIANRWEKSVVARFVRETGWQIDPDLDEKLAGQVFPIVRIGEDRP